MELLQKLRRDNPEMDLRGVHALMELGFGRVLEGFDTEPLVAALETIPFEPGQVMYQASHEKLEAIDEVRKIERAVFGEIPMQAGCCLGHNLKLNAVEYHKGSEVIVAATDMVLLLGHAARLRDCRLNSRALVGVAVPRGTVLELWPLVLHFAPIHTDKGGFRAGIFLPRGTNLELEQGLLSTDPTLWAKNKWLIAHPESPQARKGAFVGVEGVNTELRI